MLFIALILVPFYQILYSIPPHILYLASLKKISMQVRTSKVLNFSVLACTRMHVILKNVFDAYMYLDERPVEEERKAGTSR